MGNIKYGSCLPRYSFFSKYNMASPSTFNPYILSWENTTDYLCSGEAIDMKVRGWNVQLFDLTGHFFVTSLFIVLTIVSSLEDKIIIYLDSC